MVMPFLAENFWAEWLIGPKNANWPKNIFNIW
jgi:hypothetical protein